MQGEVVFAIRSKPDDDDLALHEFGLLYFKFVQPNTVFGNGITPAVWVRFSDVSQIETLQFHYPDAKLGPSHSFTEALIVTESLEEAKRVLNKIEPLFADAQMKELFAEDTMEDY